MRFRAILFGAALAAMLVAGAVAADEGLEISGKISRTENDGALEVTAKAGAYQVTLSDSTVIGVETPTTLDKVGLGTTLHVLGLKQAERPGEKGKHRVAAAVSQVRAIVAGDGFQAPPLDKDAAAKKLEWVSGALQIDGNGYTVGALEISVDKKDYPATLFTRTLKSALVKDRQVIVDGTAADAKSKQIAATQVRMTEDKTHLTGRVGNVTKDGKLEVATKSGTFLVAISPTSTAIFVHTAKQLTDVPAGTQVYVLSRRAPAGTDPSTGQHFPAALYSVLVIVAGDAFVPPPGQVIDDAKVTWEHGGLGNATSAFQLNGFDLQAGKNRIVISVDAGTAAAIVKGKSVLIDGVRTGDAKAKQVSATHVEVLAPEIPAADYHMAFGL